MLRVLDEGSRRVHALLFTTHQSWFHSGLLVLWALKHIFSILNRFSSFLSVAFNLLSSSSYLQSLFICSSVIFKDTIQQLNVIFLFFLSLIFLTPFFNFIISVCFDYLFTILYTIYKTSVPSTHSLYYSCLFMSQYYAFPPSAFSLPSLFHFTLLLAIH